MSIPCTNWKYCSMSAGCWLKRGAGGFGSGMIKSKVIGSLRGQCNSSESENCLRPMSAPYALENPSP